MKIMVGKENAAARELLPPASPDGSGIGVNYVDAYLQPLNTTLDNGVSMSCKRKGLQVTLSIGDRTGKALLRKLEHGPQPERILEAALSEAAAQAGVKIIAEAGVLYLEE